MILLLILKEFGSYTSKACSWSLFITSSASSAQELLYSLQPYLGRLFASDASRLTVKRLETI